MTSPSGPPQGAGGFPGQAPAPGYSAGAHAAPSSNGGLQNEVHTLERAIFEVKRIIVGQDQLVERMLVGLLAKGHVLLEGVPGVAKTLAVETFAKVVGGTFARIQFTPDLVPTDIVGTRIYRQGKEEFDIELGPVVVNFLLADEISPDTCRLWDRRNSNAEDRILDKDRFRKDLGGVMEAYGEVLKRVQGSCPNPRNCL